MANNIWQKEQNDLALLDEEFLAVLTEQKERELFARIASLDINELPIEYIEGKVTGGSINIDGDSAVRRTCSLTMVADKINIHDYYWGLRTKFKLEIGVRNQIKDKQYNAEKSSYPDIVWFPQGTFIIATFNTSLSVNGYTVSISGKDKMCMLNGELGGQLFAQVDFGTEESVNKIFSKASIDGVASSEILIQNEYYRIPSSAGDEILDTDDNYGFQESSEGTYYKFQNKYKTPAPNNYKGKKYQVFQRVKNPGELFSPVSLDENSYTKNTYYYPKNLTNSSDTKYYVLDIGEYDNAHQYHTLVDLYTEDLEHTITKIPIEKIIRESVHNYAKEPYHNIIINDLDKYGLEKLTYKGDKTLLAFYNVDAGCYTNLIFQDNFPDQSILETDGFTYNSSTLLADSMTGTKVYFDKNSNPQYHIGVGDPASGEIVYTFAQINYGDDLGYRSTDLTYNGDLICNIGETLTSMLDKIKNMLGDFEYFYDLDGRFVFQRKKTYINTSWSHIKDNGDEKYVEYSQNSAKFSFNFEGNRLVTAIQNNPNLNSVRNDFVVWGKRIATSGEDIPIHARYAIDNKPTEYMSFSGNFYYTSAAADNPSSQYEEAMVNSDSTFQVDWREIIYQMALDYFAGQGCSPDAPVYGKDGNIVIDTPDDFLYEVARRNADKYPAGITGYEQYYTDMQGFWRQLYNPFYVPKKIYKSGEYVETITQPEGSIYYIKEKTWSNEKIDGLKIEYYIMNDNEGLAGVALNDYLDYIIDDPEDDRLYWNVNVFENPEVLNFWIEFLDDGDELQQFGVSQIGDRSKVVNDDKVSAIVFKDVPDIILYDSQGENGKPKNNSMRVQFGELTGYTWIYLPRGFSQYLTLSYRNLSAKNKIDELLYQFGYCAENITITALPVYHLQPNTRIYVCDTSTGIAGEYIVNKITLPLTYNGTMSITAALAPERLY